MLRRGKKYALMDNAPPHRKNVLRFMFHWHGLKVFFLPPYSPWYASPEKLFLSMHMKCDTRVEYVRANFILEVLDVLHEHTALECKRFIASCRYY